MAMSSQEKLDHQLDAERAVIGSMLIDPEIVRDVLMAVSSKDFLNPANRLIFQTARALFQAGGSVDAVTIRDRIGPDYNGYMMDLMDITPTSANWREYAAMMHSQATLQRVRDLADKLAIAVTLEDCRPLCADLGQLLSDGRKTDAWTMREMLDDFFAAQDPDTPAPEYVSFGLPDVDEGAFAELGDVVMLGGYPSDGKTALALMMAYHMAAKYKVGFFSLETGKRKVRDRMVSHVAQISAKDIKLRSLSEEDWAALAAKSADMAKRDLTVLQASGMTATEIQATSQAYGFQVIFIDYVQLVTPESDRRANRQEQMAGISMALHTFAQSSGTLVVELAQLSRQDRSGGWREPDMHDLKESGQFEQDADMIFLLFRPNPKDDELDQEKNRILKIAKNKEYKRGLWPLYFDANRQTFYVMADEGGAKIIRNSDTTGNRKKTGKQTETPGQQRIGEIVELPPAESKDLPF